MTSFSRKQRYAIEIGRVLLFFHAVLRRDFIVMSPFADEFQLSRRNEVQADGKTLCAWKYICVSSSNPQVFCYSHMRVCACAVKCPDTSTGMAGYRSVMSACSVAPYDYNSRIHIATLDTPDILEYNLFVDGKAVQTVDKPVSGCDYRLSVLGSDASILPFCFSFFFHF